MKYLLLNLLLAIPILAPAQTVHPCHRSHSPVTTRPVASAPKGYVCGGGLTTVREVYDALARLGGHLGRAGDGPPGWQTLWLGRLSLRQLVEGVRLAAQLRLDEDWP